MWCYHASLVCRHAPVAVRRRVEMMHGDRCSSPQPHVAVMKALQNDADGVQARATVQRSVQTHNSVLGGCASQHSPWLGEVVSVCVYLTERWGGSCPGASRRGDAKQPPEKYSITHQPQSNDRKSDYHKVCRMNQK